MLNGTICCGLMLVLATGSALAKPMVISNASKPDLISAYGRAGAPDPGPAKGEQIVVSFDKPNAPGVFEVSKGNVITKAGSIGGVRAAPAGNDSVYRSLGTNAFSHFYFQKWNNGRPLASLSFDWGSIDKYNFVDLINGHGDTVWTLAGSDLPRYDGNQKAAITNQRVFFEFQRKADISGARFRSSGVAFEFDAIAANGGVVPEPGVWAMLITGFGLIGHVLRRRVRSGRMAKIA